MARRDWRPGIVLLFSSVVSLTLLISLFVFSPGLLAKADMPNSEGGAARRGDLGQASSAVKGLNSRQAEELPENIYLPVVFNNYSAADVLLEPEVLVMSTLAPNTVFRRKMGIAAGETISISVAPGSMTADIVLSVLDESGNKLVDKQNLSPAGEVETITDLSIAETGLYDLLISTSQGDQTDYALMLLDSESYTIVFRGSLLDNDSRSDTLPPETDHFWFFSAQNGEQVSFTVTPGGSGDAYVELYDPSGSLIYVLDDNLGGEAESLDSYFIQDRGMYGIRIGEFDFLPMDYNITFSKT